MKYSLIEILKDKKISLEFYFNKIKTIVYLSITFIIIVTIIINLKTSLKSNIGSILLVTIIMLYLSLIDFYEWMKHKKYIIEIQDDDLFINGKFIIKKDRIDSIFVEYINSQIEGGWRVYIDNFMENNRFIVKERLSRTEAIEIAFFINKIIDKKIILIKARGKEIIYTPKNSLMQ